MKVVKQTVFFALGVFLSGCSSHYLVTTKLIPNQKVSDDTEIVQSRSAIAVADKINKIAILLPSTCAGQTASAASGKQNSEKGTLMATACGVEMAALERSFARAGYEVVSWQLKEEADALVQINALERTVGKIPEGYKIDTRYDKTNSKGKVLGSAKVPKNHDVWLKSQFVIPVSNHMQNKELLGVTLDATVIYVPTKQAIWFYKKTVFEPLPKQMIEGGYHQYFTCGDPCEQNNPTNETNVKKFWQYNQGVSGAQSSIDRGEENEDAIKYSRLVGEVVKDFTDRVTRTIRN